ncbi:MAG: hypothetical protein GF329_22525 [Candidatus Lokiarchaeota archaeon]|nr:hypothetical protein [Candidatus Lokiarchaeota archaeon]
MSEKVEDIYNKKINIIWTLVIFIGFNLISSIGIFLGLVTNYLLFVIILAILNIVAIVLSVLGIRKETEKKEEIKPDTKWAVLFRKLFNIAGGLATIALAFFLGPWLTFFIMIGFLYAFGLHEILFVKYKIKTLFTNTLLAFGRDTGFEVFWPSINALSSFSFVIGVCSVFFYFHFVDFWWQFFLVSTCAILIWGVGDSTAYYLGKNFGKKKLPWNEDKSYIGSFGFFLAGSIIAIMLLSPLVSTLLGIAPLVSEYTWIFISIATSLLGAVVESLNIKLTDNFTVPAICSLFLVASVIVF